MNFALADLEAADVDPEAWPILTDSEGNLTEGSGYNVFLVTDGVIRTPGDRSILQGVSREMVFDLAKQMNIPLVEEDLQPYDMYTADEAFFASTSPCVVPVTVVDKRQVGDGRPGSHNSAASLRLERGRGPGHRGPDGAVRPRLRLRRNVARADSLSDGMRNLSRWLAPVPLKMRMAFAQLAFPSIGLCLECHPQERSDEESGVWLVWDRFRPATPDASLRSG